MVEYTNYRPGYYLVTIGSVMSKRFLQSNNERAFVISQLQDMLNARSILEQPEPHRRLSAHIDLLAFSIQAHDIRLVVFSIDPSSLQYLARTLIERLLQYQTEYTTLRSPVVEPTTVMVRLTGPHHALAATVTLHLRHPDWEFDRYSSIGFYLHDRRGGWMRLWRLSQLFSNDAPTYRQFINSRMRRTRATAAIVKNLLGP